MEKRKINYLLCTNQKDPLSNTSSLSYGHFRVPQPKDLEEVIKLSVEKHGECGERARFIYRHAEQAISLLEELKISYEQRSFGVIPLGKRRGGNTVLRALQSHLASIQTERELKDFIKEEQEFTLLFNHGMISTRYLVLATGGFGGHPEFQHTDNFRYPTYSIPEIVVRNGGTIINQDCIFIHPFGHNKGRNILIGIEVKKGDFIDEKGNYVFDAETRNLIRNNNYHEIFDRVLQVISSYGRRAKVYFVDNERKIEIHPTVHYTAGGIKADYLGRVVGCKNIFAMGECRADGSKNGGRLPGYAFTSAVVDAKHLAENLISL